MKPTKTTLISRNNNREKITLIIFILAFSLFVLIGSFVKGQTAYTGANILRSGAANAEYANNSAIVRWNTAIDAKYHFFIIERTKDKVHYEFVSMIKTTDNRSNSSLYAVVDPNASVGNTFYRISATDLKNEPVRLFEVPFSTTATASIK